MIGQKQQFKVYEQATDGTGIGTIRASFKEATGGEGAAHDEARRLARAEPYTRFYVLATVSGYHVDGTGGMVRKDYP